MSVRPSRVIRPPIREIHLAAPAVTVLLCLALGGCGSSTEPEPATLGSIYSYSIDIVNEREGMVCAVEGMITFVQEDADFEGVGEEVVSCSGLGTEFTEEEGQAFEGMFRGRRLNFDFNVLNAPCEARGRSTGDPVQSMSGTATCLFLVNGRIFQLEGPWQAQLM